MSSAITDSCQHLCLAVRLDGGLTRPNSVLGSSPWAPQGGLGAAVQWDRADPGRASQGSKALLFCRLEGLRLSYEEWSRVGQLFTGS